MQIDIIEAGGRELPVIQRMAGFYRYDLSELMGWPCPADGQFVCTGLEVYWRKPNHPFLITSANELVGFILIYGRGAVPDADYAVGEFFILRKFRGQGVGHHVATHIFDRFRGRWEIRQLAPNRPAIDFWRRVIDGYPQRNFSEHEEDDPRWGHLNVMRFSNEE